MTEYKMVNDYKLIKIDLEIDQKRPYIDKNLLEINK